jgi:hypothetical protein
MTFAGGCLTRSSTSDLWWLYEEHQLDPGTPSFLMVMASAGAAFAGEVRGPGGNLTPTGSGTSPRIKKWDPCFGGGPFMC